MKRLPSRAGGRPLIKDSYSEGFTPTTILTFGWLRYLRNKRVVTGQNWTFSIPGKLTGNIFMRLTPPRFSKFAATYINKLDLSDCTLFITSALSVKRGCR